MHMHTNRYIYILYTIEIYNRHIQVKFQCLWPPNMDAHIPTYNPHNVLVSALAKTFWVNQGIFQESNDMNILMSIGENYIYKYVSIYIVILQSGCTCQWRRVAAQYEQVNPLEVRVPLVSSHRRVVSSLPETRTIGTMEPAGVQREPCWPQA